LKHEYHEGPEKTEELSPPELIARKRRDMFRLVAHQINKAGKVLTYGDIAQSEQ
jgi:hypothetical protein